MPADGMPVQWHASPMATPTTYQLFKGVKATIADTDKTSSKTMSLSLLRFVKGSATQFTANKIACAGVYVRTVEQVLPNSRTFSAAVSTFLFSTACIFLSRGEKKNARMWRREQYAQQRKEENQPDRVVIKRNAPFCEAS